MDMRFQLIKRAPTDTLVIVEIDPYSLSKEDSWPWPRDRYAKVLENLQQSGAGLVAFDIDISSLMDDKGDAALADAIARRPGEVILPVFTQKPYKNAPKGAYIETPPNSYFLREAIVASVNLQTENNGIVRRGWRGFAGDSNYRASLAATLAGYSEKRKDTFYIDFGVDVAAINRLSFYDVLHGNFPDQDVAGKNVIVGSTAIELGDEYAAPNVGLTNGVELHALSYESLYQDRALMRTNGATPLILAFLAILFLCPARGASRLRSTVAPHVIVFALAIGAPIALQAAAPVSFDTGAVLAAQALCFIYVSAGELHRWARESILQRMTAARYQALTHLAVRDSSDGVIVTDEDGVIQLCNDRARELLGVNVEMAPGQSILRYADGFPFTSLLETLPGGAAPSEPLTPRQSEYVVKGREGVVLEIVANGSSYEHQSGKHQKSRERKFLNVYTLRDISARKRIEEEEKLAKENAIAADRLKTQLISNMSHELRTPLNGVIGFADILQKEALGAHSVEEYREYAENIYSSGKRLLNVVNDMMTVAMLAAREVEINKDDARLNDMIKDCLSLFEKELQRDGKSAIVDMPSDFPLVRIDYDIVQKIVYHLLSNAVKFTKNDGRIHISVKRDKTNVVIEIDDNGCGVAPELLPKLTEAFYQGDSDLNRQHEGAGLGLYVVSKFATLHDCALELESEEGAGFTARLIFRDIIRGRNSKAA